MSFPQLITVLSRSNPINPGTAPMTKSLSAMMSLMAWVLVRSAITEVMG